jgi:sigma-B regulation protein RsbU (phosphoserine phosphatase)
VTVTAALEQRLERMRAFRGLRHALRGMEDVEAIATAAVRFAIDTLGCHRAALYVAEKEGGDFSLVASNEREGAAETIPREAPLVEQLETNAWVHDDDGASLALRGADGRAIGILVVAAPALDQELFDELVFDVESVLSARMIAQLRAEELAVLEIQERELVGLLRDVEARDEIIQRDLEEARRFQRQMLGAPPRVSGAAVEVVYLPLGLVGGDLYAVSVDGDRVRMMVADATGHGVRASLTTMFIKSVYEAVRRTAGDPASLLAAVNEMIAHTYRSAEMLFSAACVDLDLSTGRVLTSSAAHPPICIVTSGQAQLVEGGGAFLGLRPKMKFELKERTIQPGDGIYLYTDGFTEARKGQEQFGEERFKSVILDAHTRGVRAGEELVEAVKSFLDGTPLDDDGAFVGLRFGIEDDLPPPSTRSPQS